MNDETITHMPVDYGIDPGRGAASRVGHPRPFSGAGSTRQALNKIVIEETTFGKEEKADNLKIEGNKLKVDELFLLMDKFDFWFNIVTPRKNIKKYYK